MTIETPKSEVHIVEPQSQPQPASASRPNIGLGKIATPNVKPAKINSVEPPPMLPAEPSALPSGLSDSLMSTAARTPVAPGPASAPVKGGQLQQPKLLSSVAAVFPATAKAARVQGDVTVDALIDATGKVASATVVNGNILLQQAALEAVRQWKYQPARLNGQPIAVHVVVDITFRLQ